jgi:integrase
LSLTDIAIKKAKPKTINGETVINRISDEKGMYLFVDRKGHKYFRLDYRLAGKRKCLSLGVYPETSLTEARDMRDEARKLIKQSIDPVQMNKAKKLNLLDEQSNTLKVVALEWFEKYKSSWTELHARRKWQYLEKDVFPILGGKPIKSITPRELLNVLERIQNRGVIETAHRVKSFCSEIFRYGIRTDRCERDPSQDLKGALIPMPAKKHMATMTNTKEIGGLLRAIDGYTGDEITRAALKLSPYVFLRPGELRSARWEDIDLDKKMWKISADNMKMKRPHIIPLSTQVIAILENIQEVTGRWKYVFPSLRTKDRPISNNTINGALRRLGYTKDEITAHGFRAMASTLLHENGFESAHIEVQLAHAESNKVKEAYNHADYIPQRTQMMQWWADYLDSLRNANR